jgi:hypothetical protein
MNIVGFFTADLGIGESARCMARAADAAAIPTALVPLKLNCKNRLGDTTYAGRLQDSNPFGVNVFHLDPPAARDIDHHHGPEFRGTSTTSATSPGSSRSSRTRGCPPSTTSTRSGARATSCGSRSRLKAPFPVLTMPHSISFERPAGDRDGTARPASEFPGSHSSS